MLRELQKKMKEFHMVSSGDKVLVGVSGGADSVCLLLALTALQNEVDFSLEVIHVEHGIRGLESKNDAAFVEDLCKQLQLPYQMHHVDVPAFAAERGLGLEEAARIMRYDIFVTCAKERGAKVALAHHQEDNAETILFQMVRGSSLTGLCGMQPVREDENGVCYIRPLLFFHRDEIEKFLQSKGMDWCEDCTNAELEYSRNFLRAQVIPDLEQVNAKAVEHMNQTAAHLSDIKDYLDVETERLWSQIAVEEEKITLDTEVLLELHIVMQRQIVYKAIYLAGKHKKDITSAHVDDVLDLCRGQSGRRISLPYGVMAWKEFGSVHLAIIEDSNAKEENCIYEYEVSEVALEDLLCSENGMNISIGEMGESISCRILNNENQSLEIPRKTYTKWLDYDKIKQGFCIRTRRSGDYFISDVFGHRKKLKQYFIDEKIPQSQRDDMWLIAQDEKVHWLIGGRISEDIKVSQETKYILEITYDGGKRDE